MRGMKWFRLFLVGAAVCATVAVGIWVSYALLGASLDEAPAAIALAAALLALTLAAAALVSRVAQSRD